MYVYCELSIKQQQSFICTLSNDEDSLAYIFYSTGINIHYLLVYLIIL